MSERVGYYTTTVKAITRARFFEVQNSRARFVVAALTYPAAHQARTPGCSRRRLNVSACLDLCHFPGQTSRIAFLSIRYVLVETISSHAAGSGLPERGGITKARIMPYSRI